MSLLKLFIFMFKTSRLPLVAMLALCGLALAPMTAFAQQAKSEKNAPRRVAKGKIDGIKQVPEEEAKKLAVKLQEVLCNPENSGIAKKNGKPMTRKEEQEYLKKQYHEQEKSGKESYTERKVLTAKAWKEVRALVKAGADLNARFTQKGREIELTPKDGFGVHSALTAANFMGDPVLIEFLVANGAKWDSCWANMYIVRAWLITLAQQKDKKSPVYVNTYKLLVLALETGMDPNTVYYENGAPIICWAAGCGDPAAIALLLDYGANIEQRGEVSKMENPKNAKMAGMAQMIDATPLADAAKYANADAVELLLKRGADPNAVMCGKITIEQYMQGMKDATAKGNSDDIPEKNASWDKIEKLLQEYRAKKAQQ